MATSTERARENLRQKLILERKLGRSIDKVNRSMIRAFARLYGMTGNTLQAEEFRGEYSDVLLEHYTAIENVFGSQIRNDLPREIGMTPEESRTFEEALALFFLAQAGAQSQLITNTNQIDMDASVSSAIEEDTRLAVEEGRATSLVATAVIAGAFLSRKLSGRLGTISLTETQNAAEVAKLTEAEVLLGQTPSIISGSLRPANAKKEWFTQGDEKVRTAHLVADSQSVDVNSPFIVGGEQLRYPGDTSLGASAGNVINCRCSSEYDRKSIEEIRFQ